MISYSEERCTAPHVKFSLGADTPPAPPPTTTLQCIQGQIDLKIQTLMQISTKLCILVENVIPLFYLMIEKMNLSYHVLSMEKLFSSLQTLNSTQQ